MWRRPVGTEVLGDDSEVGDFDSSYVGTRYTDSTLTVGTPKDLTESVTKKGKKNFLCVKVLVYLNTRTMSKKDILGCPSCTNERSKVRRKRESSLTVTETIILG